MHTAQNTLKASPSKPFPLVVRSFSPSYPFTALTLSPLSAASHCRHTHSNASSTAFRGGMHFINCTNAVLSPFLSPSTTHQNRNSTFPTHVSFSLSLLPLIGTKLFIIFPSALDSWVAYILFFLCNTQNPVRNLNSVPRPALVVQSKTKSSAHKPRFHELHTNISITYIPSFHQDAHSHALCERTQFPFSK